jgi:hypothetical protein
VSDTVTIPRAEYEALREALRDANRDQAVQASVLVRRRRVMAALVEGEDRADAAGRLLDEGDLLPWDIARLLGYPSADRMADAVCAYRRRQAARVAAGARKGRALTPRGQASGGDACPAPERSSTVVAEGGSVTGLGASPARSRGRPRHASSAATTSRKESR